MIPPARVGMPVAEIDTPALVIDLDAFERNLRRMADMVAATGAKLRPHAKTHKSPDIAKRQIALGAVGVCCQKVSEAEAMVRGGVGDVLISNQIAGAGKLERLAALAREAKIRICVDDADNITEIAAAAESFGVRIETLVEIDVGAGRCGVRPGLPAVDLARRIAASPHLRFAGLQAYQGAAQHIRDHGERRAAIDQAITFTRETVALLNDAGLACEIVGGAGTGTFEIEGASGVFTELQAGSYIFMDADYARNRVADGGPFETFEHALLVLATVINRPQETRAVIDGGLKTFAVDSGLPQPYSLPGAAFVGISDEHGVLDLSAANDRPARGDRILLIPGHCDPTVNLHDWYVGVRGLATDDAHVEVLWPVAARGAVF